MRATAAAALAEIFTGRLSFDLPDEGASGFFEDEEDEDEDEDGTLVAMTVFKDAIDQYNRAQLLIV